MFITILLPRLRDPVVSPRRGKQLFSLRYSDDEFLLAFSLPLRTFPSLFLPDSFSFSIYLALIFSLVLSFTVSLFPFLYFSCFPFLSLSLCLSFSYSLSIFFSLAFYISFSSPSLLLYSHSISFSPILPQSATLALSLITFRLRLARHSILLSSLDFGLSALIFLYYRRILPSFFLPVTSWSRF